MGGTPSVQAALRGLPTSRIQRLVDQLEADPDIEVTVCGWWPQCPMILAGYKYLQTTIECSSGPERKFAVAWDHFAQRENRRWWHTVVNTPYRARRCDVQALLRMANETLAQRAAMSAAGSPRTLPPRVTAREDDGGGAKRRAPGSSHTDPASPRPGTSL